MEALAMTAPHGTRLPDLATSILRRAARVIAPAARRSMRHRGPRSRSRPAHRRLTKRIAHPRLEWRRVRAHRRWAILIVLAMVAASIGGPRAQAPVGQGFNLSAADLRFILQQIKIAENHAAGGTLLGPGPNQVNHPRHPYGLR